MNSATRTANTRSIPSLDGLRALAITLVLLAHCAEGMVGSLHLGRYLFELGQVGVSLFYVIVQCHQRIPYHFPAGERDQQVFTGAMMRYFPFNLLGMCAATACSYYLIERPSLRLRHTILHRRPQTPAVQAIL